MKKITSLLMAFVMLVSITANINLCALASDEFENST